MSQGAEALDPKFVVLGGANAIVLEAGVRAFNIEPVATGRTRRASRRPSFSGVPASPRLLAAFAG
jgi:hypothetical protein